MYVNEKVEETNVKYLLSENLEKSRKQYVEFKSLTMSPYLAQNKKYIPIHNHF